MAGAISRGTSFPRPYTSAGAPEAGLLGQRGVLLDPVRDADFLGTGGNDFGLGIVDNPLFVASSHVNPTTSNTRPYPNKFFWIGSPAGTNDKNDTFNIYVADVDDDAYYPGAPASTWLKNPRLVVSVAQAKTDIIAWFDSNYPGGATAGVGNGNSGSNGTYGQLGGGTTAVGTVAGMNSIDGQFWPVYDRVDGTWLIYFSIKTPNQNTLSIYCYKHTDTELATPVTSAMFEGGLYYGGWFGNNLPSNNGSLLLSSHRFSILTPDPLAVNAAAAGQQTGVMFYAFGAFTGALPDHGATAIASVVTDIHGTPLSPGVAYGSIGSSFDLRTFPADKLGSIHVMPAIGIGGSGYACIYNAVHMRDYRNNGPNSGGAVVIDAMQLRVMYWVPGAQFIAFGSDPLALGDQVYPIGMCRPQFTNLPDGVPKLLYANFGWDQYLNLAYANVVEDLLSPKRQRLIRSSAGNGQNIQFTFGKKRAHLRDVMFHTPAPAPLPGTATFLAQVHEFDYYDPNNGQGIPAEPGEIYYYEVPVSFGFDGVAFANYQGIYPALDVWLEDPPNFVQVTYGGNGSLGESSWEFTD